MSRILRRPMFRGGRVDSRGTGITSGLSYAKGGSVNIPKRGLVDGPGGYAGSLTDPEAIRKARELGILMTPKYLDDKFRKKYYLDEEVEYVPDPASLGMHGMVSDTYGLGIEGNPVIDAGGTVDTTRDLILTGDKRGTPEEYEQFFKEKFITDNYKTELDKQKQILEAAGDERLSQLTDGTEVPKEGETREEFEARIRREAAEELQALIKSQTDKDPLEEIEKKKEIFKKAYGSGVADDASAMALSFAKNALAPDATVKSAFAGFFDDESKRPSERKKYKDAATTAAINAYLTGESSFQKFEDQLKLAKAGIDMKLEAGQPANLDEALEFFRKTGDKLTSPGLMAKAVDKIYGANTFAGPLPEDSTELIIGKVYYADDPNNSSNKVLFLIDENQEPQQIKTVYK